VIVVAAPYFFALLSLFNKNDMINLTPMKLSIRNLWLPLCIAALSGFIGSCSKEKSIDTTQNTGSNTGGNGNGNGAGNGGGQNGTDTYQPMSKDSYWKYKTTGYYSLENTTTSTGTQKTIDGINYTIFNSVNTGQPAGQALFGIKDHNYYSYAEGVSPQGGSFNVSYLYLNDTASVGYSWQHVAGQGNGFAALTPGTIVEKGLSMTVSGKNYSDVIHSRIELQYAIPGIDTLSYFTYDYYVAKNVGVIKLIATGDPLLANGATTTTELTEYTIK
jgi:hypothetical protein